MSTELVAVALTAGMAVALATVVTLLDKRKRRFQPLALVWKQYAEKRGMRFLFVMGWSHVTTQGGRVPSMEGELQGVHIGVTVEYTRGMEMTQVSAIMPGVNNDFLFSINRRNSQSRASLDLSGMVETPTGNKVFDAKFSLCSNNSDLARSILDRRLAQVIGNFRREFSYLYVTQTRLTLMWPGMEKDPQILDAAVHLVWTACRRRA